MVVTPTNNKDTTELLGRYPAEACYIQTTVRPFISTLQGSLSDAFLSRNHIFFVSIQRSILGYKERLHERAATGMSRCIVRPRSLCARRPTHDIYLHHNSAV